MEHDLRMTLRISAEALSHLDSLRKAERDLPSRAEMIRRLIERAEVKTQSVVNTQYKVAKKRALGVEKMLK